MTKAEGSGGGQAISGSTGLGERTTIAQSGSGDLYAGHDGNVYRKTDDGWQQHGDGGWDNVDTPDRPDRGEGAGGDTPRYGGSGSLESRSPDAARNPSGERGGTGAAQSGYQSPSMGGATQARPSSSDYSKLNRDAAARSGGYQSHQRRAGGMSRGGARRR